MRKIFLLLILVCTIQSFGQSCNWIGSMNSVGTLTWGCPPVGSLQIVTNSLPTWTVGVSNSANLQASGGTTPYTWRLASNSPALPANLSLSSAGLLSGTPTGGTQGTYNIIFQVQDAHSTVQTKTIPLVIQATTGTITISPSSVPNGTQNSAYGPVNLGLAGGAIPYSCSISAGALPTGINLTTSGANCVLSGTPTVNGNFSFTVRATDTNGDTPVVQAYSMTVVAAGGGLAQDPDFYCPLGANAPGTWPIPTPNWGGSDGPAALPVICLRTNPDNTPTQTPGNIVTVTSGSYADLQSKIAGLVCGEILQIPVATYSGTTALVVPALNCADNNWITIESANFASLPAYGQRISIGNAGYSTYPPNDAAPLLRPCGNGSTTSCATASRIMPLITNTSTTTASLTLDLSGCVHCNIRLLGLELVRDAYSVTNVVQFATGAQYNANVIFDRDIIRCKPQSECSAVVGLGEASNVAFVGTDIFDAYCLGNPGNCTDSEDVAGGLGNDTKSGLKFYNTYGDATGHVFESGGGGQLVAAATLSDAEFRDSDFHQLDGWFLKPDFAISPHNATVAPNGQIILETEFFDMTNAPSITIQSTTCGTATVGTNTFYQERFVAENAITFTAPAAPTTCTVTVKATHASQTATASTTVTVTNTPQSHIVEIIPGDFTANPQGNPGLRPGAVKQYWALVDPVLSGSPPKLSTTACGGTGNGYGKPATCPNGSDSTAHQAIVNWYVCTDNTLVTCTLGGNATVGTISNSSSSAGLSGLYTAPTTIPGSNPCIKAIATVDNTSFDYSCVAISGTAEYAHAVGAPGQLKYIWECKSCQRMLAEGNIVRSSYAQSDEQGFLISYTPKNQAAGKYTSSSIVRNGDGTVTFTSTTTILSNIAVNENVNVTGAAPSDLNGLFVITGTPPACSTSGFCTPCKHGAGTAGACTATQFEYGQVGAVETATTQGSGGISVAPAAEDQNLTWRYSELYNTCDGSTIGVGNSDNGGPPLDGGFFEVHDTLWENLNCSFYNPLNASSQGYTVEIAGIGGSASVPIHDFEMKHNTFTKVGNNFFQYGILNGTGQNYNLRIHDNILYSAVGFGSITFLNTLCSGANLSAEFDSCGTFTNGAATTAGATCNTGTPSTCLGHLGWFSNVLVGANTTSWTGMNLAPMNNIFETNILNVLFVNYTGDSTGDYRLCTGVGTPDPACTGASPYLSGSDGLPYGANVTAVKAYTQGVAGLQ